MYDGSVAVSTKCVPCPAGTAALWNSFACEPCAQPALCPFGSSLPLLQEVRPEKELYRVSQPIQPGPLVNPSYVDWLFWTYFAVAVSLVVTTILTPLLFRLWFPPRRVKRVLARLDFFPLAHPVEWGASPIKRQTALGGQASLSLMFLSLGLICYMLHKLTIDRMEIVQSTSDVVHPNEIATSPITLTMSVLGIDRRWACEHDCRTGVDDGRGTIATAPCALRVDNSNACEITATLLPDFAGSNVQVWFRLPGTRAHAILWNATSSVGGDQYLVQSGLVAPKDHVLWCALLS